ncbi:MAG: hypothetical protein C4519_01300 [Desulfobacteraceae bacterium]|nr:MAG: hypothetical protein C4519_01300 [Desulfobacteraceae bacterium]
MFENDDPISEQRAGARRDADQPIAFSLFNTRQRLLEHPCRTCNHSETGMCFESFQRLHPGMVLCIMRDQAPPAHVGELSRETALAEVRWCRLNEEDNSGFYKVGVRFY